MRALMACALLLSLIDAPSFAQDNAKTAAYSVPEGKAVRMLRKAAGQGQIDLVLDVRAIRGFKTQAIKGRFTAEEALQNMLQGTPLKLIADKSTGAFAITRTNQRPQASNGKRQESRRNAPQKTVASNINVDTIQPPPPSNSRSASFLDGVVELDPFVVNTSEDLGYRASNTLSSGRFNTYLRDTAASVTVFTEEFMDDVAIQNIDELAAYSLGTTVDTGDAEAGANIIAFRSAESTVPIIRIRGLKATKGRNFFQSLTPDDSYRNGRYDESRGPNGILFGISNAGGMVSSSTLIANTNRDSHRIKYTFGSWNENRSEARTNKVLVDNKLAVSLAGLYQDSDDWRDWVQNKSKRAYASVTYKPNDRITLRAMGESGEDFTRQVTPFTFADQFLAWDDYGRNTAQPNGENPPRELAQLGVANSISNNFRGGVRGRNPRHVFIENDGTLHNLGGTYLSTSYNNDDVLGGIQQLDGRFGSVDPLRLNLPQRFPYQLNLEGADGTGRTSQYNWWQAEADLELTDNLYLSLAHNEQQIEMENPFLAGADPAMSGDPNITLGVIPANPEDPFSLGEPDPDRIAENLNPYAGRLYVEADQRFDIRLARSKETRIGLSYHLDTDSIWIGAHQMAIAASRRTAVDLIENHRLAFLDAPFNANPTNNDNLVWNRYYFDEDNLSDYAYRQSLLPYRRDATTTILVNDIANPSLYRDGIDNSGVEREIGWVRGNDRGNQRADERIDSYLAVTQSSFLSDRLALTLGYREDHASAFDYGLDLGRFGYTVDQSAPISEENVVGRSKTGGMVYHLNNNLSLVANYARSVGVPNFIRRVLPEDFRDNGLETVIPPAPDTGGEDYGIDFSMLGNAVKGRLIYFKTSSDTEVTGGIAGNIVSNPTQEIFSILEDTLLDSRYAAAQWEALRKQLTTDANGILRDTKSEGYELRLTANPTDHWRLSFNFSYTDRRTINSYKRAIPWLGYIRNQNNQLLPPFDYDGANWTLPDTPRIDQDGVLARLISLAEEAALVEEMDFVDYLNTGRNNSIAGLIQGPNNKQWFRLNDQLRREEQRWGLRPYKANVFMVRDFKDGFLKGFSLGGGLRWQSRNIIGGGALSEIDPDFDPAVDQDRLVEFEGVDIFRNDLMMRYRKKLGSGKTLTYQVNVYNAFDDTDIIPQRLATTPNQMVPGGPEGEERGVAMHRFDLVDPRSYRISVTYDF